MLEKNKRNIIICGKGGSGKNYLQNILVSDFGYKPLYLSTTRPVRPNERGDEYIFLSEDEFNNMDFADIQVYRDWFYGVPKDVMSPSTKNVIILTPQNIKALSEKNPSFRRMWNIIYITASDDILRDRLEQRCDQDSTSRRMASDNIDFNGFGDVCDFEINTHLINTNFIEKFLKLLTH